MKRVCAVTGASGYVGSRVAAHMRARGWDVLALSGNRGASLQPGAVPYSLEEGMSPDALRGVDALIHCAYDFRPVAWADISRINVQGSARLLEAARRAAVRKIVCVSSISAFEGCRSLYGKAKMAIEREARSAGGVVVRPGLVYGKGAGGMLGALNRIMASGRIVPLIGNGSWTMYLAFDQDLCRLVEHLCELERSPADQPITAAFPRGKPFREILSELARAHGRKPLFIPVPWRLVWLGLAALESSGLKPGFRSDSVLGLVYAVPRPSFREIEELGMTFRDFRPELLN